MAGNFFVQQAPREVFVSLCGEAFPRITVVTPCFNHQDFVGETIRSVLGQGYPNLQYIVINDGSTDDSESVISAYDEEIDLRLTLGGHRDSPVEALNRAFELSDGEILCWVSSDDILLPGALLKVGEVFRSFPDIEWLTAQQTTINADGQVVRVRSRFVTKYDYLCGRWSVIQQESTFFRRRLWARAGGRLDDYFVQAFDTELWSRFFLTSDLHYLDAPLGAFRRGKQSKSHNRFPEFQALSDLAIKQMRRRADYRSRARSLLRLLLLAPGLKTLLSASPRVVRQMLFPWLFVHFVFYDFREGSWRIRKQPVL